MTWIDWLILAAVAWTAVMQTVILVQMRRARRNLSEEAAPCVRCKKPVLPVETWASDSLSRPYHRKCFEELTPENIT